jgi:DNA-binding NarL/FixJ family response regulator
LRWGGITQSESSKIQMVIIPASAVLRFAKDVRQIEKPADVLAALQNAIPATDIRVAAAWYLAKDYTDHAAIIPGKTLFVHDSLPLAALWSDYIDLVRSNGAASIFALGRSKSAPFTLTEAMRQLQLAGDEDWIVHMFRRHHIRDGLYCPFRRWALTFWSPKLLDRLQPDTRAMLFTFAGLAIGRIDTLVRKPEKFETNTKLSERELSVLRLISCGHSNAEVAAHLKIGPETVKHHIKRAMRKLKARDRAQAVASAIRQGLMS